MGNLFKLTTNQLKLINICFLEKKLLVVISKFTELEYSQKKYIFLRMSLIKILVFFRAKICPIFRQLLLWRDLCRINHMLSMFTAQLKSLDSNTTLKGIAVIRWSTYNYGILPLNLCTPSRMGNMLNRKSVFQAFLLIVNLIYFVLVK